MHLYAHQQRIIDADLAYAGLFLGTGSGKTRIALALARKRTLVICPKTQKEDGNWEREFMAMCSSGPIGITELVTISKETFRRDWEKLPYFNTVIVDEGHTCLGVTPNTRYRKKKEIHSRLSFSRRSTRILNLCSQNDFTLRRRPSCDLL